MNDDVKTVRKTNTYNYLETALVQLLRKTKYEEITVKDLVEKAGISRMTFYTHFTSKQDFVDFLVDHIHFGSTLKTTDDQNMKAFSEENFIDYYIRFFNYVALHAEVYRVMLSHHGLSIFRDKMKQDALKLWQQRYFTNDYLATLALEERKQADIMLSYIISAHMGLVEYWLENNMEESPRYMASQLYQMTWLILSSRAHIKLQ